MRRAPLGPADMSLEWWFRCPVRLPTEKLAVTQRQYTNAFQVSVHVIKSDTGIIVVPVRVRIGLSVWVATQQEGQSLFNILES